MEKGNFFIRKHSKSFIRTEKVVADIPAMNNIITKISIDRLPVKVRTGRKKVTIGKTLWFMRCYSIFRNSFQWKLVSQVNESINLLCKFAGFHMTLFFIEMNFHIPYVSKKCKSILINGYISFKMFFIVFCPLWFCDGQLSWNGYTYMEIWLILISFFSYLFADIVMI